MPEITLDIFCSHWVKGKWNTVMASKLQSNIFNFVTIAGKYTHEEFVSSFIKGSFGGGPPWAPRTSSWGKRFTHPVLVDSGTLAKSIKGEASQLDIDGRRDNRKRITGHRASFKIWTTEISSVESGKRGRSRRPGSYHNYAAVHNTDPKYGLFTVNQYSSHRPVHRQFIGFSPKIDDYVSSELLSMIFEGFPQ